MQICIYVLNFFGRVCKTHSADKEKNGEFCLLFFFILSLDCIYFLLSWIYKHIYMYLHTPTHTNKHTSIYTHIHFSDVFNPNFRLYLLLRNSKFLHQSFIYPHYAEWGSHWINKRIFQYLLSISVLQSFYFSSYFICLSIFVCFGSFGLLIWILLLVWLLSSLILILFPIPLGNLSAWVRVFLYIGILIGYFYHS